MVFRIVFWDILPCKMIIDRRFRGASETSVDNHFTRQYIPEDNSEKQTFLEFLREGRDKVANIRVLQTCCERVCKHLFLLKLMSYVWVVAVCCWQKLEVLTASIFRAIIKLLAKKWVVI
jgi:hypothetical protein